MSRIIKFIIGFMATVVGLLLIAIGVLTYYVRPAAIKAQAISWFDTHTDRTLSIDGDLHWSFIPSIGLTAKKVSINGGPQFGNQNFINADNVKISLELRPLLHGNVSINRLLLNQVYMNLVTNKKGLNNWDVKFTNNNTTTNGSRRYDIHTISLKNSTINYRNEQTGNKIELTKANVKVKNMLPNKPFTITGSTYVNSNKPNVKTFLDLNGKVQYDPKTNILNVTDFELSSSHSDDPVRTLALHTTGSVNFKDDSLSMKPFEINYAKTLKAKGNLQASSLFSNPNISGHLQSNTFNLKTLLNNFGYSMSRNENKILERIKFAGDFNINSKKTSVSNVNVDIGKYTIKNFKSDIVYDSDVLTLNNIQTNVFSGKSSGNLRFDMSGKFLQFQINQNMQNIQLAELLELLFDDKPVTGISTVNINIRGSNGSSLAIKKSLTGTIDVQAQNGVVYGVDVEHQFSRAFSFLSKTKVTKRDTNQTRYKTASAKISLKNGMLNNHSLKMHIDNFDIIGSGNVNLSNEKINYSLGIKSLNAARITTPLVSVNLADFYIPLGVGGTISNPRPSLNLPGIATMTLKEAAKDVIKMPINTGKKVGETLTAPVKMIKEPVGETLKKVLPFGKD